MKFRQRVAWLLLFCYLLATIAACYYVFEVSEMFGRYAVDHVRRSHPNHDPRTNVGTVAESAEDRIQGGTTSFWHHVADVPLPLLGLVCLLLYSQVLCLLCACTRPTFTCHPLLLVVPIAGCVYLHRATVQPAAHRARTADSVASNQRIMRTDYGLEPHCWLPAASVDFTGPTWKVTAPGHFEPVANNADESLCFLVT